MNTTDKYYKLTIKCKNLNGEVNYINSVKINGISKKLKYLKVPVLAYYDTENDMMIDVITEPIKYRLNKISDQELEYLNYKEAENKDLIFLQKIMSGQIFPKITKLYTSRLETINEIPNEYLLKRKK